jgi:alkylhydroperoxidase family enzyme
MAVSETDKPYDIAAREAAILGKPPRIPPIPENEIPPEAREEMNHLRAGIGLGPLEGPVPVYTAIMMKARELNLAHLELANFLFRGKLAVRDRELVVLRVGWLCKAPFEWGSHVAIAKRLAHATEEEILRVQKGPSAPGWSDHERALIQAVDELWTDAMISDATWAVLAKTLTEAQLLELPITVGQYLGVAFLQNSVRVPLLADNPGLSAR